MKFLASVLATVLTAGAPFLSAGSEQVCVGCRVAPPPPRERIIDGDWSVSIVIGDGVSRSDAEQIVRAFHRGELVERHKRFPGDSATASYVPSSTQASQIGRISVAAPADFGLSEASGRFLSITTFSADGLSGREYLVAVRDGRVELLASLIWIS